MERKNYDCVSAFRKYARYGFDKAGLDIFEICDLARGAAPSQESALALVAVYQTMQMLECHGRKESADVVRAVYFSYPNRPIKKNEISWRVRRFAHESYMDERTVYRHLRAAKELFLNFYEKGVNFSKKFEKTY